MRYIIIFLLLVSCCPSNFDDSIKTIYCEKIFMNQGNQYTGITNGKVFQISTWKDENVDILYDVPSSEKMYIRYQRICKAGTPQTKFIEIHLHSPDDLGAGGWNHGKFGQGQMNVLE